MPQKIYNTRTRQKEIFHPLQEGAVGIYVCGITAYDVCHIGHARAAVAFDVAVRHLRSRGYRVTYVKNFTDIDDKIIERAKKEGISFADIAERYIKRHDEDMAALGVATPDVTPRATEHMDEMIALIGNLMDREYAYAAGGDVYFSVSAFPLYGGLSGRNLDELMAGARVDVNEKKKNPLDFALWKASKEGEPCWESPWGKGRPGWHIECSAMSRRYLGETFDIHGGGEDLIFPHHENEIAQSQAATGKPLANYWMHNGFVKINSEKMSKSLGNIFPIRDIIKNFHPEILRFFMLQSHYRSPVDYSDTALNEARSSLIRCYTTLRLIQEARKDYAGAASAIKSAKLEAYLNNFLELDEKFAAALDDDFNTAQALGFVFEAVRLTNNILTAEKKMPLPEKIGALEAASQFFAQTGAVLGVFQVEPEKFLSDDKEIEARKRALDVAKIENLIAERQAARSARNWARADEIRQELARLQITLQDSANSTEWSIE